MPNELDVRHNCDSQTHILAILNSNCSFATLDLKLQHMSQTSSLMFSYCFDLKLYFLQNLIESGVGKQSSSLRAVDYFLLDENTSASAGLAPKVKKPNNKVIFWFDN